MKIFNTKTGLGYFKDSQGRIISRFDLPIGEHPIRAGFTAHDVANQIALKDIVVYKEPPDPVRLTKIEALKQKLNLTDEDWTLLGRNA